MKILEKNVKDIVMRLTKHEITAFNNALNETLEVLEEWEYESRIGITVEEAEAILKLLQNI